MNPETKLQSFGGEGHPDENELLLALEHELPSDEIVQIDNHLGGCWSCRARSEEMRRGILTFVEYRENLYLPSLEKPPTEFCKFPLQLKSVIAETQRPSAGTRFGQVIVELLTLPRSIRWVGAVAIITIIALLWTHVLSNPTEVSAQELLTRAIAAQNPAPVGGVLKRKRIHQKVQIRSGARTVVRDYEWTTGMPMPAVRWKTQEGIDEWSSPLLAEAFGEWRNSLAAKKDTVKPSRGVLTLTTTSETGPVKEASIIVRAMDFHPLEQHILFSDEREFDFLELGFEVSDEAAPSAVEAPEDHSQTAAGGVSKAPPANLDEVELNVRYVLFTHKLDLGEDLLISQVANDVMVSGTASSQARADAIRTSLEGMENVRLRITSPRATNISPSMPSRSATNEAPTPSPPPLGEEFLTKAFPSAEERTTFVDRCLTASDKALSHAWALKRLADRYSEAEERRLKPESAEKLREMLRTHLEQLSQTNTDVDPLLRLLPGSEDKSVPSPADLRSGIISLFHQVQEQDSLVTKLVAGTPPAGEDLPTVAEELHLSHRTIKALTDSLRDFL